MSTRLYGRSDIHHVAVGDHEIVAKRHKAPAPWDADRTIAVIEHDDPKVLDALRKSGWHEDPRKVGWTPDEEQARTAMKEEGDVLTAAMAREFANAAVSRVTEARSGGPALPPAFLASLSPEQRALLSGPAPETKPAGRRAKSRR